MSKTISFLFAPAMLVLALAACHPEDRSDERPLEPTVINKSYEIVADSCLLVGEVTSSHNSTLKGCGFRYGNYASIDTLRREVNCKTPQMSFSVYTKALLPGSYYAVAFAQNGIGKTLAPDSLFFTIEE